VNELRFPRAVITDEISQDLAHAVAVAKSFGLDGIELRSAWDRNPHELTRDQVQQVKKIAGDFDMAIPCLAAPIFKCDLHHEEAYVEHRRLLEQTIRVAEALGTRLIRGFTFWEDGRFDSSLSEITDKIGAMEPLLKESGRILVIESDPATSANSSQRLAQVLERIGSENIRALWDPGNNLYVPEAERPFPEGYERLKPYIAHIHIKDVRPDPATGNPDACCLGEGAVGFAAVFKRLQEDAYPGWLSLETHYRINASLSEELLALPKGIAFSLGGEAATRECLESWNTFLKTGRFDG
jgi:sugar phosphate isomerase/epimerase